MQVAQWKGGNIANLALECKNCCYPGLDEGGTILWLADWHQSERLMGTDFRAKI